MAEIIFKVRFPDSVLWFCRKSGLGKFGKFKSGNFLDMKYMIVIYPWLFKTACRIN